MARYLITSAIPYINGIKHLGNLVGSQLPADLYARYLRQRDHEVMFICATDEHGTPAELAATESGKPVAEFCEEMHKIQTKVGSGFRLSFDYFGRSSSPQNHKLTQYFAGKLADAGLIEEIIAKGEGKSAAIALAAKVAKQSPVAVAACKTLIQKSRIMPISQALPQERQAFVDLFDSVDQKEGVQAFLEKRKPVWLNK